MWLCQCRDACWCCKSGENSNSNVTVILDLNQPSTTLGTGIETTFTQHCLNVVSTFVPNIESNITTTFTQHCLNIVSTLVNVECDIVTTFTQCWLKVVWMLANVGQCCDNVGNLVEIQRWYNIRTTLSGCPHNVAGMLKSIYIWTLPQHWDQCWGNVGTNFVTMLPQRWSISWAKDVHHSLNFLNEWLVIITCSVQLISSIFIIYHIFWMKN